jgi:hypothetical protein
LMALTCVCARARAGITCDGCHPVDAGYQEIAVAMAAVLKQDAARYGWPAFGDRVALAQLE